ncbi:MAG: hypothetical protein K2X77_15385 [Candidatus Obscuribacterales bacterium]|nr:hypothetical protein [Candidatus Obscuribacterales bacterium]
MFSGLFAHLKRLNFLAQKNKKQIPESVSDWSRIANMRLQALTGENPIEVEPVVQRYFPVDFGNIDALRNGRKRALAYWTIPGHATHSPEDSSHYTPDRVSRLVRLCRYEDGLPFLADAELMWEQERPKELWDAKHMRGPEFRCT